MSSENLVSLLLGIMLGLLIALFIYLIKEPMFQTKTSITCTIPATEWKCQINVETNEITCKGRVK
jgi:hypothetical protein